MKKKNAYCSWQFCFLSILLLVIPGKSSAQKEYNTWVFAYKVVLSFNATPPSASFGNAMPDNTGSPCAISDKDGNLLFYSQGDTTYNRNHQVMKNGICREWHNSRTSPASALIVKYPKNDSLYYVFHTPWKGTMWKDEVYYSIVNMKGDGGLGEVIVQDEPILGRSKGSLAIAMHSNGYDYWIASKAKEDSTLSLLRTIEGIIDTSTTIRTILSPDHIPTFVITEFSPDSKTIITNESFHRGTGYNRWVTHLYKFDNSSGQIYDHLGIELKTHRDDGLHWSFSPDSKKLYAAITDSNLYTKLVQFDLSIWDSTTVAQSEYELERTQLVYTGLQIGPDAKLYVFRGNQSSLSVIHKPNLAGVACDYRINSLPLAPAYNHSGYFNYPYFAVSKVKLPKDTTICNGQTFMIEPNLASADSFRWSTGEITRSISVNQSGTYILRAVVGSEISYDTIEVTVAKKFNVFLGNDSNFCGLFKHVLQVDKDAKSYNWNTGDTSYSITVDSAGMYWVKVKDKFSCSSADTINLSNQKKPKIKLGLDTVNCEHVFIDAGPAVPGMKYSWSSGDTVPLAKVNAKGKYYLTTSSTFCTFQDTIEVKKLPKPEAKLGPDRYLCGNATVFLKADDADKYEWSTGDSTQEIEVEKPGFYWVRASSSGCELLEEINIFPCEDLKIFLPGAFSPNKDGHNDTFSISSPNILHVSIKIYNRWGELVYTADAESISWDGKINAAPCPEGLYFCMINIKGLHKGKTVGRSINHPLMLIR